MFAGTDTADWFYQIGIPNNPDALYKELIKRSILRKARDDNRDDILNVCLEEQDIPESNETQTVLTDWFESADIPDIAIKLGELNTQKAESDKKILKYCRGGLMSMIKPFDLEHESVEDEKYIINGVMMERNIGNVIGASKQGKSYFIEEMLFCMQLRVNDVTLCFDYDGGNEQDLYQNLCNKVNNRGINCTYLYDDYEFHLDKHDAPVDKGQAVFEALLKKKRK